MRDAGIDGTPFEPVLFWQTARFEFDQTARKHVLVINGRLSEAAAEVFAASAPLPAGCRGEIVPSGLGLGGIPSGQGEVRIYSDAPLKPRADEIRTALEAHLRVR